MCVRACLIMIGNAGCAQSWKNLWPNALCCSNLHISECKFVSLSLSSLVKTETKLFIIDKFCIPCKRRWLINDLIDIWLFPSVYVFCKKIWFIVIVELKYQRWNRKKRKKMLVMVFRFPKTSQFYGSKGLLKEYGKYYDTSYSICSFRTSQFSAKGYFRKVLFDFYCICLYWHL